MNSQTVYDFSLLLLADLNKDGKLEWKDFDLARKVEVTHALKQDVFMKYYAPAGYKVLKIFF